MSPPSKFAKRWINIPSVIYSVGAHPAGPDPYKILMLWGTPFWAFSTPLVAKLVTSVTKLVGKLRRYIFADPKRNYLSDQLFEFSGNFILVFVQS